MFFFMMNHVIQGAFASNRLKTGTWAHRALENVVVRKKNAGIDESEPKFGQFYFFREVRGVLLLAKHPVK